MKVAGIILQLVALGSALVIPDEQVLRDLTTQPESRGKSALPQHAISSLKEYLNHFIDSAKDEFESVEFGLRDPADGVKNALDAALDGLADTEDDESWHAIYDHGFDVDSWLRTGPRRGPKHFDLDCDHPPPPPPHDEPPHDCPHHDRPHDCPPHDCPPHDCPPHDCPPHDCPPHDCPPHDCPPHDRPPHDCPHDRPPHGGPPHHGPPHHPPHHKSNQSVYELIAKSKYTTRLAKLIDDDPELVELLNGTTANFTVFAPTDRAFEKIPKHHKRPSEDFIKKLLRYHVSPELYPAGRVLHTHTIPTLYKEPALGSEDFAQRLSVNLGFRGLTLNFYSRVIAINIFGINGVIHGIDSIIVPPPKTVDILTLLPGEFSTLTLGLAKTGLLDTLNSTDHAGGTFFAPSNWAFRKLGPRINAFLFSSYGEKYLKALLEYHVVPDQTLYSDAFYRPSDDGEERSQGYFHVDLPTLLENKYLSVDVGSHGPFTEIKINGFSRVAIQNGVARDGVIQVVSNVLIPPKTLGTEDLWQEDGLSIDEFKARFKPLLEAGNADSDTVEPGWGEL